jgi:hypothetical protein
MKEIICVAGLLVPTGSLPASSILQGTSSNCSPHRHKRSHRHNVLQIYRPNFGTDTEAYDSRTITSGTECNFFGREIFWRAVTMILSTRDHSAFILSLIRYSYHFVKWICCFPREISCKTWTVMTKRKVERTWVRARYFDQYAKKIR